LATINWIGTVKDAIVNVPCWPFALVPAAEATVRLQELNSRSHDGGVLPFCAQTEPNTNAERYWTTALERIAAVI
jgi:hypothetical protein